MGVLVWIAIEGPSQPLGISPGQDLSHLMCIWSRVGALALNMSIITDTNRRQHRRFSISGCVGHRHQHGRLREISLLPSNPESIHTSGGKAALPAPPAASSARQVRRLVRWSWTSSARSGPKDGSRQYHSRSVHNRMDQSPRRHRCCRLHRQGSLPGDAATTPLTHVTQSDPGFPPGFPCV